MESIWDTIWMYANAIIFIAIVLGAFVGIYLLFVRNYRDF